jgi:hypothetical protein
MSELREFTEFAKKPLVFPFRGKKYVQPDLTIEAGLYLGGVVTGADRSARNMKGADLWKLVCGPLWDQMIADGVPLAFATRVGLTLLADHQYGRDYAEATWEAGTDPKLLAAYMDKKTAAQGNRASRRSSSTAGATKTPPQVSTKATTSRKR